MNLANLTVISLYYFSSSLYERAVSEEHEGAETDVRILSTGQGHLSGLLGQ